MKNKDLVRNPKDCKHLSLEKNQCSTKYFDNKQENFHINLNEEINSKKLSDFLNENSNKNNIYGKTLEDSDNFIQLQTNQNATKSILVDNFEKNEKNSWNLNLNYGELKRNKENSKNIDNSDNNIHDSDKNKNELNKKIEIYNYHEKEKIILLNKNNDLIKDERLSNSYSESSNSSIEIFKNNQKSYDIKPIKFKEEYLNNKNKELTKKNQITKSDTLNSKITIPDEIKILENLNEIKYIDINPFLTKQLKESQGDKSTFNYFNKNIIKRDISEINYNYINEENLFSRTNINNDSYINSIKAKELNRINSTNFISENLQLNINSRKKELIIKKICKKCQNNIEIEKYSD